MIDIALQALGQHDFAFHLVVKQVYYYPHHIFYLNN